MGIVLKTFVRGRHSLLSPSYAFGWEEENEKCYCFGLGHNQYLSVIHVVLSSDIAAWVMLN